MNQLQHVFTDNISHSVSRRSPTLINGLYVLMVTSESCSKFVNMSLKHILSLPFILLIRIYQLIISPLFGPTCRFTPTCSQYGLEAFRKYGPLKGGWLTLKRLSKCHPWGGHGHDPVP